MSLSKSDRLSLIALIAGNGLRPGLVAPSVADLTDEVKFVANPLENHESILEEDYNYKPGTELLSQLSDKDDVTEARAQSRHADSDILTPFERKQIQDDLWRYRHPVGLWLAPISLFNPQARLSA